jgi:hypothetical protein
VSRSVAFYRTAEGRCPIKEFLDSLPAKVAQKVAWVLSLLEDLSIVPSSYFKKLAGTEEIWDAGFSLVQMLTVYFVSSQIIPWLS